MAPASNEEQFKFLISCIRYSNNGKVDFGQVAKECKIVSKGAAAKRYERMMRAHGINSSSPNTISKPTRPSPLPKPDISTTSTSSNPSTNPLKKRKIIGTDYLDNQTGDDDEGLAFGGRAVKNEAGMGGSMSSSSMGTMGDMHNSMSSNNVGVMSRSPTLGSFAPPVPVANREIDLKEKLRFMVKEEDRASSMEEQSQGLSMTEAVDLMRFYDTSFSYSSSGLNDDGFGSGNGYDLGGSGNIGGYSTSYGLHTPPPQAYQLTAGYGAGGSGYGGGSPVVLKSERYAGESGGYGGGSPVAMKNEIYGGENGGYAGGSPVGLKHERYTGESGPYGGGSPIMLKNEGYGGINLVVPRCERYSRGYSSGSMAVPRSEQKSQVQG